MVTIVAAERMYGFGRKYNILRLKLERDIFSGVPL